MTMTDVSGSAARIAPPRRRRRWYWLLGGILVLVGGLAACEGWATWQERLARQALWDDRMDAARHHIELALKLHPYRTSTLLLAARIRRLRGGYPDAEQYLLRCVQPDGSMSESVQLEWQLLRCQEGEVDELAPQLFALVKQQHPQSIAILETLSSMYLRQMRYLEAILALNLWLELVPDSVRALDWRGWVGIQLDHREQGIRDYERLLELQPNRSDIRLRLAQVLIESARHPQAAPHLERLLREQPDNPDAAAALAPCRILEGKLEEAQALLDAVLQNHPDHFDALFQRGKLEITLGHPAAAEPWLRKALQVKPHDKEARYNLFRSLQGQPNRQQEADREQERWEKEGEKQDRLSSLLRKYLAAHPNDPDLAREAGELLLEIGEEQRGLSWLLRAVSIDPRHVPSHRALLAYYERTNQKDKAEAERRLLEETRP